MKISDWIATKGEDKAYELIQTTPGLEWLRLVFKSPSDILPTCDRLGWITLDDAKNGCFTLASVMPADIIEPKPDLRIADCVKVSWVDIDAALRVQKNISGWHQFWNTDAYYHAPHYQDLLRLADRAKGWISRHGYVNGGPETNDCDDTVKAVLGWLSRNGLGNLAAGKQDTVHTFLGKEIGGHASVLVYCSDGKLYQWEPMGNADGTLITPATFPRLNGFTYATGQRLVTAFF